MRSIHVPVMLLLVVVKWVSWNIAWQNIIQTSFGSYIWNGNSHFVGSVSNSLFSLCLHSYVLSSSIKLELVGWGSGEKNKQRGRSGYEASTYFMALDVREKYHSQILWPLEHLVISVAFRQSKHGELCSFACIYCICLCIYTYILLLWIFSVLVYILVCLCRMKNTQSPLQHKTIHPKSTEVVAYVIETCDKKQGRNCCWRAVMYAWISWWTIGRVWRKRRERNAKSPE